MTDWHVVEINFTANNYNMRNLILTFVLISLSTCFVVGQSTPFISEFHYDDIYSSPQDSFEFVEVYVPDPQPANLGEYKITLYQGTAVPSIGVEVGDIHRQKSLADHILFGDTPNGAYYVVEFPDTTYLGFTFGGIENGPDGIAISGPGDEVYMFLSYEGAFTAIEGPANGMTSLQITNGNGQSGSFVQENNSTPTTCSLQQNGFGAWTYCVPFTLAAENQSHSPTGFSGNVPVTLLDFETKVDGNNTRITWTTAQEVNSEKFVLQHSYDGRIFTDLKNIPSAGNSDREVGYQHLHKNLKPGNHYYRLQQYDFDGTMEDFGVRVATIGENKRLSAWPTITTDILNIAGANDGQPYEVYNSLGQKVMHGTLVESSINVIDLYQGTFYLRVAEQSLKFIKN